MDIKFIDNHIELSEVPRKPKKITGTRLASILGLNQWNTPFQMFCEITKAYGKPFEDNIYTTAGKVIEGKLIQYLKDRYFLKIKSAEEVYGADFFSKTRGDFYDEDAVFGGMWDAKGDNCIVEIKTTKRAEDWLGDAPLYYKLQASLYAYLSNVDDVYLVCAFLSDKDYASPESFVPARANTIVKHFKVSEEFPTFYQDYISKALLWWKRHIIEGVSPDFDEDKDAEYLQALRTKFITIDDTNISYMLAELEEDQKSLDIIKAEMKALEDKVKKSKEALKKYMQKQFGKDDTKCVISGGTYDFTLSKTFKSDIDKKLMEKDGLLDKYTVQKVSYTLTNKRKDEK